jgi:hypothetical protein
MLSVCKIQFTRSEDFVTGCSVLVGVLHFMGAAGLHEAL